MDRLVTSNPDSTRFLKILITILSISILPVLILNLVFGLLTYFYVSRNFLLSSTESLSALSAGVDENIKSFENLLTLLAKDEDIISFSVDPDKNDYSRNARLMETLNLTVGAYDYISSIYIYSARKGLIMASSSGIRNVNAFYDTGWIDEFNHSFIQVKRLAPRTVLDERNKKTRVISLISRIPRDTRTRSAGLVINLNQDKLFENLRRWSGKGAMTYVFNRDGYIIEHSLEGKIGNFLGDTALYWKAARGGSGFFLLKGEGPGKIISYYSSPYSRWIFINEVQLKTLVSVVRGTLFLNVIIVLIAVLSVLFAGFHISKAMYVPVQQLFDSHKILEFVRPVMHDNILFGLLHNLHGDSQELNESLALIGADFNEDGFIVLVFELDEYFTLRKSRGEEKIKALKSGIMCRIEELAAPKDKLIAGEMAPNQIIVLLNFSLRDKDNPGARLARRVLKFAREEFQFTLTCGIGTALSDIMEIGASYYAALEAVQQKMYLGNNRIIESVELRSTEDGVNAILFIGPEMEKKLLTSVRLGNISEVSPLVKEMISEIRLNHPIDVKATLQVFNRIATALMEMRLEKINAEGSVRTIRDLYCEIRGLETLFEVERWLIDICSDTAAMIKEQQGNRINVQARKIAAYIDANLESRNISLIDIGDAVGLSPSYVSRVFKEYYGTNYIEYLNRNRVQKAKQYLSGRSMTIQEIAGKLGFSSLQTFIRVFKKYERVSPGRYRNRNEWSEE